MNVGDEVHINERFPHTECLGLVGAVVGTHTLPSLREGFKPECQYEVNILPSQDIEFLFCYEEELDLIQSHAAPDPRITPEG